MTSQSASHSPSHAGGAASPSISSATSSSGTWDVQDILAERTSSTGANEVLVVWKPSWIPITNVKPGDVLDVWKHSTPKWTSAAMNMKVMLPMAPDSQLAKDVQHVHALYAARYTLKQHNLLHHPTGPRKQLGKIAKKQ